MGVKGGKTRTRAKVRGQQGENVLSRQGGGGVWWLLVERAQGANQSAISSLANGSCTGSSGVLAGDRDLDTSASGFGMPGSCQLAVFARTVGVLA
jgi:hypothetical protein